MACSIQEIIKEREVAIALIDELLESLRDMLGTNIGQEARNALDLDVARLTQRKKALIAANTTEVALRDDGYPDLPKPATTPEIDRDLKEQARTIQIAAARYKMAGATSIVSVGRSVPKGASERPPQSLVMGS